MGGRISLKPGLREVSARFQSALKAQPSCSLLVFTVLSIYNFDPQ